MVLRQQEGRTSGPAFCDQDGYVTSQATMNEAFLSCLETVKEDTPDLFAPDQQVSDFDIDRTLRRALDSRAKALGVSLDDINGVHRWEKIERAKGRKAAQSLSDSYADVEHLRPMFMRYTQGL